MQAMVHGYGHGHGIDLILIDGACQVSGVGWCSHGKLIYSDVQS